MTGPARLKASAASRGLETGDTASRQEGRRELERFRRWLEGAVAHVSPLSLDLLRAERIRLHALLDSLQPHRSGAWNGRAVEAAEHTWLHLDWCPQPSRPSLAILADFDLGHEVGRPVRWPGHPRGAFGVSVTGRGLRVVAEVAGCLLLIEGGEGVLVSGQSVPEQILTSQSDRMLGDLVGHRLFTARSYPIRSVEPRSGSHGVLIRFTTTLVPSGWAAPDRTARR